MSKAGDFIENSLFTKSSTSDELYIASIKLENGHTGLLYYKQGTIWCTDERTDKTWDTHVSASSPGSARSAIFKVWKDPKWDLKLYVKIKEALPEYEGELMDIEGAKASLKMYKTHYPYRKWCALQVFTDKGETWITFDNPSKMKAYMKRNNISSGQSISY